MKNTEKINWYPESLIIRRYFPVHSTKPISDASVKKYLSKMKRNNLQKLL